MTGQRASRAEPLRPGDPTRLGRYTLVGRLGQGGMGTVYLADTPENRQVALKVIRGDLAHDPEFRRRFRGEVNSARQVPPFCTAEVLDADPDHDQPYLVVEYVDGPSLAAMVEERGPLSAANLHGLAIGVATALTAIHGAGVIHRDLKPTNVLLAPGSPKVIDFGIARAVHGESGGTRQDQMIGTIAYMAPERFAQGGAPVVTAAADIFAWGAVVAYAGTGHTPYRADSPEVIAVRIMTQPPDLDGLPADLRGLVAQALDKDPAKRPTARDLLDRLLSVGPQRPRAVAAALAQQPALLRAAEDAQAATGTDPTTPVPRGASSVTPTYGVPPGATTRSILPATDRMPAGTKIGGSPRQPSRAGRRIGIVAGVLVAALIGGGTGIGLATGAIRLPGRQALPGGLPTRPPAAADPAPKPSIPAGATKLVSEPLAAPGNWWKDYEDADDKATCHLDGALVVTHQVPGPFRCKGMTDKLSDVSAFVTVRLLTAGTCAGLWFRFDTGGYALRVCENGYFVVTHGPGGVRQLESFPATNPLNKDLRVGVFAQGSTITLYRAGKPVGTVRDSTYQRGRVVLGIFPVKAGELPSKVSFADVEIWSRPPGRP